MILKLLLNPFGTRVLTLFFAAAALTREAFHTNKHTYSDVCTARAG